MLNLDTRVLSYSVVKIWACWYNSESRLFIYCVVIELLAFWLIFNPKRACFVQWLHFWLDEVDWLFRILAQVIENKMWTQSQCPHGDSTVHYFLVYDQSASIQVSESVVDLFFLLVRWLLRGDASLRGVSHYFPDSFVWILPFYFESLIGFLCQHGPFVVYGFFN